MQPKHIFTSGILSPEPSQERLPTAHIQNLHEAAHLSNHRCRPAKRIDDSMAEISVAAKPEGFVRRMTDSNTNLIWVVIFRTLQTALEAAPTLLCGLFIAGLLRGMVGPGRPSADGSLAILAIWPRPSVVHRPAASNLLFRRPADCLGVETRLEVPRAHRHHVSFSSPAGQPLWSDLRLSNAGSRRPFRISGPRPAVDRFVRHDRGNEECFESG